MGIILFRQFLMTSTINQIFGSLLNVKNLLLYFLSTNNSTMNVGIKKHTIRRIREKDENFSSFSFLAWWWGRGVHRNLQKQFH